MTILVLYAIAELAPGITIAVLALVWSHAYTYERGMGVKRGVVYSGCLGCLWEKQEPKALLGPIYLHGPTRPFTQIGSLGRHWVP